ncbi:MAG: hypothetical protein ABSA77_01060, partial [Thermoguttaceae bacterium]
MSLDDKNTKWMIRVGRILSRLFSVLFVALLFLWLTTGWLVPIFFFGALFSLLWSHSVEISERVLNLEVELSKLKKQI